MNNYRCSYCKERVNRNFMTKLPKDDYLREKWFAALGEEFKSECGSKINMNICLTHFELVEFCKRPLDAIPKPLPFRNYHLGLKPKWIAKLGTKTRDTVRDLKDLYAMITSQGQPAKHMRVCIMCGINYRHPGNSIGTPLTSFFCERHFDPKNLDQHPIEISNQIGAIQNNQDRLGDPLTPDGPSLSNNLTNDHPNGPQTGTQASGIIPNLYGLTGVSYETESPKNPTIIQPVKIIRPDVLPVTCHITTPIPIKGNQLNMASFGIPPILTGNHWSSSVPDAIVVNPNNPGSVTVPNLHGPQSLLSAFSSYVNPNARIENPTTFPPRSNDPPTSTGPSLSNNFSNDPLIGPQSENPVKVGENRKNQTASGISSNLYGLTGVFYETESPKNPTVIQPVQITRPDVLPVTCYIKIPIPIKGNQINMTSFGIPPILTGNHWPNSVPDANVVNPNNQGSVTLPNLHGPSAFSPYVNPNQRRENPKNPATITPISTVPPTPAAPFFANHQQNTTQVDPQLRAVVEVVDDTDDQMLVRSHFFQRSGIIPAMTVPQAINPSTKVVSDVKSNQTNQFGTNITRPSTEYHTQKSAFSPYVNPNKKRENPNNPSVNLPVRISSGMPVNPNNQMRFSIPPTPAGPSIQNFRPNIVPVNPPITFVNNAEANNNNQTGTSTFPNLHGHILQYLLSAGLPNGIPNERRDIPQNPSVNLPIRFSSGMAVNPINQIRSSAPSNSLLPLFINNRPDEIPVTHYVTVPIPVTANQEFSTGLDIPPASSVNNRPNIAWVPPQLRTPNNDLGQQVKRNLKRRNSETVDNDMTGKTRRCVYCKESKETIKMTRVPKKEGILELWINALGDEFAKYLDGRKSAHICLSHFEGVRNCKRRLRSIPKPLPFCNKDLGQRMRRFKRRIPDRSRKEDEGNMPENAMSFKTGICVYCNTRKLRIEMSQIPPPGTDLLKLWFAALGEEFADRCRFWKYAQVCLSHFEEVHDMRRPRGAVPRPLPFCNENLGQRVMRVMRRRICDESNQHSSAKHISNHQEPQEKKLKL